LPSSSTTSQPGRSDRSRSFFRITCPSTHPDGVNGVQSTSRQATETAATHIPPHHSQLQSVQTIDNDDDSDGNSIIEGTHSASDIIAWLPLQLYFCCLLRSCPFSFQESRENVEGLATTASRDTYVTAHSRPSASTTHSAEARDGTGRFGKIEVPRWIGEVWSRVSPYVSSLSQLSGAVGAS
jgi:hypothetical protein